jgi:glycosyltransferase involved in cell wall biosynthesis
MAQELGIAKDRIAVIPHGIPVYPHFQRLYQARDELQVVFLGRLEIRKGTFDLLHAIPQVVAAFPQVRFTFIGKDREHCPGKRTHSQYLRDEFPAEVRARIDLLGELPQEGVDRWLQAADVLVAPSLYESFGLVFLEALRWGTPVVGTRAGAIPEIIDHGQTGLLVPPEAPGELAQAIVALLRDAGLRRALGEAGRRRVETHYTVERMARQVGDLYQDVLDEWGRKTNTGRSPRQAVRCGSGGGHE